MKATLTGDTRQIMAKFSALRKAGTKSVDVALTTLTEGLIRELYDESETDTNRLKNGYADMYKQAGLGDGATLPKLDIKPSKYAKEIIQRLTAQRDRLGKRLAESRRNSQGTVGLADIIDKNGNINGRKLKKATKVKASKVLENQYRRAQQQLDLAKTTDSFIMIYNQGREVSITIRPKVYGGFAYKRVSDTGNTVIYEFRHREPHAILRERENRRVATKLAALKVAGIRKVKQVVLPMLLKAMR